MKKYFLTIYLIIFCASSHGQGMKEAIESFNIGKYPETAQILSSIKPSTPKSNGFLCQLYAEEKISPDREISKQVCDDAVFAKDPVAVYTYALAYIYGNDALQIPINEKKGLGFMAVTAIDLDFSPAFDFFCEKYFLEKKYNTAVNFCKVAAHKGLRKSLHRMSLFYSEGLGVIQNFEKSKQLMLASAALNYAPAYEYLGDAAKEGKNGYILDLRHAYAWYSLSAAIKSDNQTQEKRKALKIADDDVLIAQKMAAEWKYKNPKLIDYYK
jgi:TPR repeat protein